MAAGLAAVSIQQQRKRPSRSYQSMSPCVRLLIRARRGKKFSRSFPTQRSDLTGIDLHKLIGEWKEDRDCQVAAKRGRRGTPVGARKAIAYVGNPQAIHVDLATDKSGAVRSTALDVIAAVRTYDPVNALVTVEPATDGSGLAATGSGNLAGGTDEPPVKATLAIGAGASGIRYTARGAGSAGNAISGWQRNPGQPDSPLSVYFFGVRLTVPTPGVDGNADTVASSPRIAPRSR